MVLAHTKTFQIGFNEVNVIGYKWLVYQFVYLILKSNQQIGLK